MAWELQENEPTIALWSGKDTQGWLWILTDSEIVRGLEVLFAGQLSKAFERKPDPPALAAARAAFKSHGKTVVDQYLGGDELLPKRCTFASSGELHCEWTI